jgi:hypothetical protein
VFRVHTDVVCLFLTSVYVTKRKQARLVPKSTRRSSEKRKSAFKNTNKWYYAIS